MLKSIQNMRTSGALRLNHVGALRLHIWTACSQWLSMIHPSSIQDCLRAPSNTYTYIYLYGASLPIYICVNMCRDICICIDIYASCANVIHPYQNPNSKLKKHSYLYRIMNNTATLIVSIHKHIIYIHSIYEAACVQVALVYVCAHACKHTTVHIYIYDSVVCILHIPQSWSRLM